MHFLAWLWAEFAFNAIMDAADLERERDNGIISASL